ncbi:haloacid dehalogenase type II [Bacillus spongiae]|uniref:Haloacid dehalogenase type II n=1 Tax=Bacillus spongiae TaxID=2683610 RepID=A0ABU8HET4_9BACI
MNPNMKAIIFDVYGTLFDVYSITSKCEELYPGNGEKMSTLWRKKQLEYAFLCQLMDKYRSFLSITRSSLKYALNELQLLYNEESEKILLEAYKQLSPFPEVESVLQQLQNKKKLVVFSNGSHDMLEPLVKTSTLSPYIDDIISIDDVKQYKPTPASYLHALRTLGYEKEEILFVSSNGWDIIGATNFGFKTAWVNRKNLPLDELDTLPHFMFRDLSGMLK